MIWFWRDLCLYAGILSGVALLVVLVVMMWESLDASFVDAVGAIMGSIRS